MSPFALQKDVRIIELKSSERIDERYLRDFVISNLKLKNVFINKNEELYINYIENINEYQIFLVDKNFNFFEFEVFYLFYKDRSSVGFELFICEDFFTIFNNSKLYYYQKINQKLNQKDFVEFLNKKFEIDIHRVKEIKDKELESLKNEFLKLKTFPNKEPLKKIYINKKFGFSLYVLYIILLIFISYYYYHTNIKVKESKSLINFDEIEQKLSFSSFEEKLSLILKEIDKNKLELVTLDFAQNRAKIVLVSNNKNSINKFLETYNQVVSSSINFIEDSSTYEATIDVKIFDK